MQPADITYAREGALDLEAVYRLHAPTVARWAARLAGPSADVEDLVHDTFVVVERKLSGFRGDAKLTTWLYRITENVVRHARRKRRVSRWLGLSDIDEPAHGGPSPEAHAGAREAARTLYDALDRLPERHRTALILHALEGQSAEEIAELLGVKTGTVFVWLHRGRRRLEEALER